MASNLVIKVRYGDTLRRFNVAVRDDGQLSLDMDRLRATILGLFNIPPESEIRLTYVDEDGDVVTLVDDYDLQEVMRQNLKFLKVAVTLKHAKAGSSNSTPASACCPFRSPSINDASSNVMSDAVSNSSLGSTPEAVYIGPLAKTGVPRILKSAPLREALSKLSVDLASQNGSSSLEKPLVATNLSTQAGDVSVPNKQFVFPYAPEDGGLHDGAGKSNGASRTTLDEHERGPRLLNPVSHPIDLTKVSENDSSPLRGVLGDTLRPLVNKRTIGEAGKESKEQSAGIPALTDTMQCWGTTCPRSNRLPNASSPHVPVPLDLTHAKSFYSQNDGLIGLFHQNIICDGCGIVPIAGPRYKSKLEENQDLCSLCFADIVNKADYVTVNTPMPAQHSQLHDPVPNMGVFPPRRSALLKLDCCFVLDVNVEDGTIMAPCTTFTKIWRMRNTGLVVWPCGTRLVQIGGDKFSCKDAADLEIPVHGVPVDAELDVSMDFTSPASPGRYISSWRMASPYGTPFGQRIWVHIQVDVSLSGGISHGFNLNVLPECEEPKRPGTVDVKKRPGTVDVKKRPGTVDVKKRPGTVDVKKRPGIVDVKNKPVAGGLYPETYGSEISSGYANPIINGQAKTEQEKIDSSVVGNGIPASARSCSSAMGLSHPAPSTGCKSGLPTVKPSKPDDIKGTGVDDAVEEMLLKDLEEMGFKQVNLNKEILRMNQYDLEQSLNDLCGVSECDDSVLQELEEMGFCNKNMNKRLLKKNNGSIKRVVLDLIRE